MNNSKVKIKSIKNLSDNWYKLDKVDFDYQTKDGKWQYQQRECYDRGDGAAILLYNPSKKTVILTKQFRMPTYLNENEDGMMIEVCAGLLDADDPLTCIKKEAEEETGFKIDHPKKIFEIYSTPGAVTEKIHYYIAEYSDEMKISEGGGLEEETEEIEVIETDFNNALEMISTGEICDAKSIILLQYAQIHKLVE
ncbi:nudix-type nucleoside diphosphatase, YffH/AdpP family [Lutibacter agarilyticus]|uniref:GDP-mannose pyrophosphatase n=1 Tax=Lutibacter agarilyticus TaxID=1109740 RepID=A0A238W1G5_9FLAO|nr:NUDIX domain-containing protein [Lutibacter agarilyticus]SNR40445.1 nudix-type nucleoside diphosphatase, YffH/AdpP family [Lutibacter agarilyticus]